MKKRKDGRFKVSKRINGKRVQFYGDTVTEAMMKLEAAVDEGLKPITYRKVCEEWREQHFKEIRHGTELCYNQPIKDTVALFGDQAIKDITPAALQLFLDDMKAQGYARRTVAARKTVLSLVFRYAMLHGYITNDPTTAIRVPKGLKVERRLSPDDEVIATIKENTDKPGGLFPFLLLYTGLRKGEALALQYKDIDFENNTIRITKNLTYNGNKPHIGETKTEAGKRTVLLLSPLADKIPRNMPNEYYLFGGKEPLSSTQFRHMWDGYCLGTGLTTREIVRHSTAKDHHPRYKYTRSVTPHQLRHAFATILFEAGIDEFTAKEMFGHTDIKTMQNIYTHLRAQKLEAERNKLEMYIKQGENRSKF